MVFTGKYEHTIDAKNRVSIPAEFRSQIQEEVGGPPDQSLRVYVTLGGKHVLSIYTVPGFNKRAEELDKSQMPAEELLKFERMFFSHSARVELDKQGRVLLPDTLLDLTGLKGEVVLVGVKDRIEIHSREAWNQEVKEYYAEQGDAVGNPRLMMKPPGT